MQKTGQRMILKEKSGREIMVTQIRNTTPPLGQTIHLMLRRSGSDSIISRNLAGERKSLAQYVDMTMSFDEFLGALHDGYHFPEAGELGTVANRKGQFQTGRTDRNKVRQITGDTGYSPPASGAP